MKTATAPPRAVLGAGTPRAVWAAAAVSVVVVPWLVLGEAAVYKLGLVLIVAIAALGLHILVNWAGEVSLGHAALIGLPAFVVARLSWSFKVSALVLLPLALLIGAILGALVALPALRARGLQMAIVTLAFNIGIDRFFFTKPWLVQYAAGAQPSGRSLGPFEFVTNRSLYPLLALVFVLVVVAMRNLFHSKFARALLWMRSSPGAASTFGVRPASYRILAYSLSGALAGLAGGLTSAWVLRLTPQGFPITLSLTYLTIVVLGGRGFVGGVIAAAAFFEGGRLFLPERAADVLAYVGPIGLIWTLARDFGGINGMVRNMIRVRESTASGDRLDAPPAVAVPARPASTGPLLGVDGVSVAFGGLQALDSVSLEVAEREAVGLIGPNGAGKTTLFNVVSGLQSHDTGEVVFGGRPIAHLDAPERAALGMRRSFQNLALAPDETALTNVLAAQHLRAGYGAGDALVRPWLSAAHERRLRDQAMSALTESGLDEYANQPVGSLPFGVARMIELVSVFLNDPVLVLLDEPTNGLDAHERDQVSTLLDTARQRGTTLLVVAHDVRFIMGISDRMYVLSEGRVLFSGTPAEVRRHDAVAEVYLGREE